MTATASGPPPASHPDPEERPRGATLEYAHHDPREFDPDSYRMSVGQHLEELRWRLILGGIVFAVVMIVFIIPPVGTRVVAAFCWPLMKALEHDHLTPQITAHEVQETFMVFIRISMISAAAIASPWILYQLWKFVAAGLYPRERKYITKYLPLSIGLLVAGMAFVYFLVLPLMLEFFLSFNISNAMHFPVGAGDTGGTTTAATQPLTFPRLASDPADPQPGTMWFNAGERRLKVCLEPGETRVLQFGSEMLVTPLISLSSYIDMMLQMLISFGLAFQMPLAVLAVVKIGIVEIAQLKKWRRVIYFSIAVVAAFIVPDVASGMLALMFPLILLYEFGILLAVRSEKQAAAAVL